MPATRKTILNENIVCPHCEGKIKVIVEDELITPATPAEKERHVLVEKDTQTTLAQ